MGKICELQIRMDGEYAIVCRKEKCSCMKNKKKQHWKPVAKQCGKSVVNALECGLWKSSAHEEERQSERAGWGKDGWIYSLWFYDLFFFTGQL